MEIWTVAPRWLSNVPLHSMKVAHFPKKVLPKQDPGDAALGGAIGSVSESVLHQAFVNTSPEEWASLERHESLSVQKIDGKWGFTWP